MQGGGLGHTPGNHFLVPVVTFLTPLALKLIKTKGSISHALTVCIHTENQNQVSLYPFVLYEISILIELTLGHLHYHLTVVLPQPNSQPDSIFGSSSGISPADCSSHLFYTSHVFSQSQTRVKLNRVFFPRCCCQARSLCCGFAR